MSPPLILAKRGGGQIQQEYIYIIYMYVIQGSLQESPQEEFMNIVWVGIYIILPKLPFIFVDGMTNLYILVCQYMLGDLIGTPSPILVGVRANIHTK